MAGKQTPVVLIPRYTSFVGPTQFYMDPLPVSAYSAFSVTLWVGIYAGGAPAAYFGFQESNDGVDWTDCDGVAPLLVPSGPSSQDLTRSLTKAWVRASVGLTGAGTALTCYCLGYLEQRER